jgi:hypothetical protein
MGLRIGLAQDYLYMLTLFFSVNRLCFSQCHVCLPCNLPVSRLLMFHFLFLAHHYWVSISQRDLALGFVATVVFSLHEPRRLVHLRIMPASEGEAACFP